MYWRHRKRTAFTSYLTQSRWRTVCCQIYDYLPSCRTSLPCCDLHQISLLYDGCTCVWMTCPTWQQTGRELNPRVASHKSIVLPTTPPSHTDKMWHSSDDDNSQGRESGDRGVVDMDVWPTSPDRRPSSSLYDVDGQQTTGQSTLVEHTATLNGGRDGGATTQQQQQQQQAVSWLTSASIYIAALNTSPLHRQSLD